MGFIDKFLDRDKTSQLTVANPRETLNNILRQASGSSIIRELKYNIFYQIIAFKGVVDGVGTSTLVANTALALANAGLKVCVIDTSVLQPVQSVLLKTKIGEPDTVKDWFDMPYLATKGDALKPSTLNNGISVLDFKGKNRGIVDILSTNDSSNLVEIALSELQSKFDIILIDCCHELTSVNTACLQMAQKVIQVWNDTPTVASNIDSFITNCVTLSCPMDKMRYVVFSKLSKNVMGGNLDNILSQYRFKEITRTYNSEEVAYNLALNKQLYQLESKDEDVTNYTNAIIDVFAHICNVENGLKSQTTVTSDELDEYLAKSENEEVAKDTKSVQGNQDRPEIFRPETLEGVSVDEQFEKQEGKR